MSIEFFRNEMMNKLFVPMVATGAVALTTITVTSINWSGVGNTLTSVDMPSLPEFGGNGSESNGGTGTVDDTEEEVVETPSVESGGGFSTESSDYDEMGGLDTSGTSEEDLAEISFTTTSIMRCTDGTSSGAFMEFGFNDDMQDWTYLITTELGTDPVKLLSYYTYADIFADYQESFGYKLENGTLLWSYQIGADTTYGNNDGTVSWQEWKDYVVNIKSIEQGFGNCNEYAVENNTTTLTSNTTNQNEVLQTLSTQGLSVVSDDKKTYNVSLTF